MRESSTLIVRTSRSENKHKSKWPYDGLKITEAKTEIMQHGGQTTFLALGPDVCV